MTVVWRSSSAGMLVPVTEHISAATLPVACVDSVPPVPGRAGKLRSLTDDAGSRKRARRARKWSVCPGGRSQAVRLVRRSRRQKAAGRHDNWLQLALTFIANRASTWPISIERSTTEQATLSLPLTVPPVPVERFLLWYTHLPPLLGIRPCETESFVYIYTARSLLS